MIARAYEDIVEVIARHVRNQEYTKLDSDYEDLAAILPGEFRFIRAAGVARRDDGTTVRRAAYFRRDGRATSGDQPVAAPIIINHDTTKDGVAAGPSQTKVVGEKPPQPSVDGAAVELPARVGDDLPPALLPLPGPIDPPPPVVVQGKEYDETNVLFQAMTILSYSIAVESGILNDQLRLDMRRVLGKDESFGGAALGDGGPLATRSRDDKTILASRTKARSLDGRDPEVTRAAIGVESAVLNDRFRDDMKRTIGQEGVCAVIDRMRFYSSRPEPAAQFLFEQYVMKRWRLITFALDPVVDQQNIADASSVKRDLQLALAFAFSTGQINFNQLTQFQRRIEIDAETIALNRTVSSFAHGNDTFGFRFMPRFQNPPLENSNLKVIANQLIRGGPGRDYQIKNSKLEAGQRELSVVVVMPSFLHGVQMDVTGNWFPLHDPDEMEIPTKRMIEQGRKVVALKEALNSVHDQKGYRSGDIQRLKTRANQLEAMLPMQTLDVGVPYENTIGGFQLFQQGLTSLVPELNGFEGADSIAQASPGTDLFLFGKHFSVQETNVIVGGIYLSPNSLNRAGSNQSTVNAVAAATPAPSTPAASPATAAPAAATTPSAATTTASTTTTAAATPAAAPAAAPTSSAGIALPGGFSPSGSAFNNSSTGTVTTANNPAIDIISREVLRVSIPAGVSTMEMYDADTKTTKTYVEVYVATPTGISNRLPIPYVPTATAAPAPGYAIDAKSQNLTVNYTLRRDGPTALRPVNGTPADQSDLTINWTSPLGTAPKAVQVSITFTYKNAKITIPLNKPIVQGSRGKYKLAAPDLQAIAKQFIDEIAKVDNSITLANPLAPITVDSVDIAPDDTTTDNQSIKASGTLKITPQIVNSVGLRAPASDPSVRVARYVPQAAIAANPQAAEEIALPPLPPAARKAPAPTSGPSRKTAAKAPALSPVR